MSYNNKEHKCVINPLIKEGKVIMNPYLFLRICSEYDKLNSKLPTERKRKRIKREKLLHYNWYTKCNF